MVLPLRGGIISALEINDAVLVQCTSESVYILSILMKSVNIAVCLLAFCFLTRLFSVFLDKCQLLAYM